jgi:hypothetical protein
VTRKTTAIEAGADRALSGLCVVVGDIIGQLDDR